MTSEKKRQSPERGRKTVNPLFLPKGSVRALSTLSLSVCFWGLAALDRPIPQYLFTLVMAVLAYYFGYRKQGKGSGGDSVPAPGRDRKEPLFLPKGFIRRLLIIGFCLALIPLYLNEHLSDPDVIEFFSVLIGLVAGYLFNRIFSRISLPFVAGLIAHLKAVLVIVLSAGLAAGLIMEHPFFLENEHYFIAFIGFYFGSRS